MYEVTIREEGSLCARLFIRELDRRLNGELTDYSVELHVERGADIIGIHRKMLSDFPSNALNSVALLKAALNLFDTDTLGLEDDSPSSPDMARRQCRTLSALPGKEAY